MKDICLSDNEPFLNPSSVELANVILNRIGLNPRKKGSTERMSRLFIEFYERAKLSGREKNPSLAAISVEEMASIVNISRQTMYEYLSRWLKTGLIVKTSYLADKKAVIGYKLNGNTLEEAFNKTISIVNANLDLTKKYILELQKTLKNEKISKTLSQK